MKSGELLKKILVSWTVLLFVGTSVLPGIGEEIRDVNAISGYQTHDLISSDDSVLDVQYIYNITRALSSIVFTEYDEEKSEIAMGRSFGTKGEHKAAEILLENMTKLGLWTHKERIKSVFPFYDLTNKIEILDYDVKINNASIEDCYARGIPLNPKDADSEFPHNFSYKGLKILREHPAPEDDNEDYVLINRTFTPDFTFNGESVFDFLKVNIKSLFGKKNQISHPHCVAVLSYDYLTNDTYDMEGTERAFFTFFINKSVGEMIDSNAENLTVDFYVKQRFNKSVESYNVIGQLNGTNPTKTVLVCCLYDGWWGQCTADSAIGMAMVLGIAKYFVDHEIKPKYNIKFIGFGGEEYGRIGSRYYQLAHRREKIIYVIDLNQVGFKQDGARLRLEVVANNKLFLEKIWKIVERTDYINRTENTADIVKILSTAGHLSDDRSFALNRHMRCKTVCFLKNGEWYRHHRDGLGHTEGDVLKYFDPLDVAITGEIVWNVTKYFTVD